MLQGINILVAEDNVLNQKIVTFLLQKEHAAVVGVLNGRFAIDALREQNFDVILMDLQMPEMDGYAATSHIRQVMHIDIPIIAVTASISDEEQDESLSAGMNAYISKPFDPQGLCKVILNLVHEHKSKLYTEK